MNIDKILPVAKRHLLLANAVVWGGKEIELLSCEGLIPECELVKELSAGPHKKRTVLKLSENPTDTLGHSINLIDLDFNGHTNNRRYVQMALVCFHQEFLDLYRPDSLNIRFLRESRMGDEIVNETYSTDIPDTYVGRVVSGRGEDLCRVTSHWTRKEPVPDIAEVNLVRN